MTPSTHTPPSSRGEVAHSFETGRCEISVPKRRRVVGVPAVDNRYVVVDGVRVPIDEARDNSNNNYNINNNNNNYHNNNN